MENGTLNHGVDTGSTITIKGILSLLMASIDENNDRRVISLGMGDPSAYSCFHTTHVAEQAVVDAIQSEKFNGYAPTVGLYQTRRAIAEYLSRDLPYKLSSDDVFVTSGCTQAIDVALAMLARPGANILLPRPGFPIYELCAGFRNLEVRYFDLLPEKGWEADLNAIEALADKNTVAVVVINPGNPCGNVYSYQHLKKIAETAKRLRILVIADEVYGHLAFGKNPFVPMGVFGSEVPVLTLGSLSKRWIVPGWRLGWFVTSDPGGMFREPKTINRIKKYFDILGGPATFIQAAVPSILEQTEEVFFRKTINLLKEASDVCYEKIKEIPCITCPHKPEGSMAVMVKLNISVLEDVSDDIDFCFKLAERLINEEPDEVEWRLLMALCYETMGQFSTAKRLFKKILEERPLLLRALHGLALVMHKNHEGPAVLEMLNKALDTARREKRVTEERNIKILIAQMHVVKGELDEALKKFQDLVNENPRDFRPYLCQGIIYSLLDKKKEADGQFETYRALAPKEFPQRGFLDDVVLAAKTQSRERFQKEFNAEFLNK